MKTQIEGPVRARFAPSPTGFLHVGGARTAIYNELLRKSVGGAFILRIEDTDRNRSDEAMIQQIRSALAWLGVEWDEGPFLQSAQVDRHRERAEELLASGAAYRCFCTPEELDVLRAEAQKKGETFTYPRTCLHLSEEEIATRREAGEAFVVRFRMPAGNIRFADLVRGEMDFPQDALDDFILLRSDGSPTYHMSVVVDDIDMGITHVIRGEDHLSNTPKHVPLFRAFGAEPPVFAHLPLILGPDKKRLSKRVGSTSVEEFRAEGFLPQALYNYLALLGWSPGDDREILSKEEMIEAFTMERLNASAAIFDREKLLWMNGQYLWNRPMEEILPHLAPFLAAEGLAGADPERLGAALELHRLRARTLRELAPMVRPYFEEKLTYDAEACGKYLEDPALPDQLRQLRDRFDALPEFTIGPLEEALRLLADELGVKAKILIHPTRMALSAAAGGPSLFDLVALMGREGTRRHFDHFIAFLEAGGG